MVLGLRLGQIVCRLYCRRCRGRRFQSSRTINGEVNVHPEVRGEWGVSTTEVFGVGFRVP